ncbi:MAG: tetratricopeptide repeat protein [Burkholderiales bacterium]
MNRDRLLERVMHDYRIGALDEARSACEEILRVHAEDVGALNMMAAIAADERKTDEGMRWARLAMAVDPTAPAPHYSMGRLCQGAGRLAEAEAHYRRSLELQPDQPKALNNLGAVLHMQGRLDLAVASYRRALELDPELAQANQNLASITRELPAAEKAVAGFLRQLRDNPKDAEAHANLGNVYRELGRHREAIASFADALACDPEFAEAHFARSFELLLCGEYTEGWKEFEWRWKVKALNSPMRHVLQPLWDGRDLPGGTVLLHSEQGFGDTLQFVRYAPLVAQRCGRVMLECQPELVRLLARTAGLRGVYAAGERLPSFDAHLPLMSLPRVFNTRIESIPWDGPYIQADTARAAPWRSFLASSGTKIGLNWAGRPQQWDDRKRSVTLAMLAPLMRAPDANFYSLQKGEAAAQATSAPQGMRLADLGKYIGDFADTAAIVRELDLVITVDTSVAHLAAAMGVPTWVLVSYAPDWRYHLEREDNPWYPSMRLFRQKTDGDWPAVIERLAAALAERTRERPSRPVSS